MKYKYHTERRDYKYGSGERFASCDEAMRHVAKVRNELLTKLALAGYYKGVRRITVRNVKLKNLVRIKITIAYPVNLLRDE